MCGSSKNSCYRKLLQDANFLSIYLYVYMYSVFHQFRHAKFANGGSILSSSQFLIRPQLPQKMKLTSKVVKSGQN